MRENLLQSFETQPRLAMGRRSGKKKYFSLFVRRDVGTSISFFGSDVYPVPC